MTRYINLATSLEGKTASWQIRSGECSLRKYREVGELPCLQAWIER